MPATCSSHSAARSPRRTSSSSRRSASRRLHARRSDVGHHRLRHATSSAPPRIGLIDPPIETAAGFATIGCAMPPGLPFDPIAEAEHQWRVHWGPDAVASMAAVTSIMRVQQILLARLNAALKPWELTFPRYEALLLLHYSRRGSLPLGKIGDRLQVHRASVTNVIDRLEGQGLVRRVGHETDRRAVLAEITRHGREVAQQATLRLNEQRFGTAPLHDDDLDRLFALLRPVRVDAGDFEE